MGGKVYGPLAYDVKRMYNYGLIFRNDVPDKIIYQDCHAQICRMRDLNDAEIIFAWQQVNNYYDNPDSLIEETSADIYQVYDTTLEQRNNGG